MTKQEEHDESVEQPKMHVATVDRSAVRTTTFRILGLEDEVKEIALEMAEDHDFLQHPESGVKYDVACVEEEKLT